MNIQQQKQIRELQIRKQQYKIEALAYSPSQGQYDYTKMGAALQKMREIQFLINEIEMGVNQ